MSKHKCGSCRYFQEARLASSGWCHHPQRRTTSDVMIMVRRHELACRDEWSHDLWAPIAAEASGTAEGPPADGTLDRIPERREPPATPAEIAAVIQARSTPADGGDGRLHEDVVVGETLVIAESERDWTWQSDDAAASRVVDTRAAIIKARETYRDRAKTDGGGRPTERAPLSAEDNEVPSGEGTASPEGTASAPPAIDMSPSARPPEPSLRLSRPATIRADDEVPSVDPDFDLSRVARRPNDAGSAADGEKARASTAHHGDAVDRGRPAPAEPTEAAPPVRLASRRFAESGRARGDDRRHGGDRRPPEPALVPDTLERSSSPSSHRGLVTDDVPENDLPAERREEATTLLHGRRRPFRYDPPPVPAREVAGRWGTVADDDQPLADDPVGEEDREAAELAIDEASPPSLGEPAAEDIVVPTRRGDLEPPVDLTIRVAPDLPRTCRLCRDYRPAEGGGRGWCANEWAFTHRRVVDPDERMPCETSLGSWWLPVDAIWLSRTDVSSHGQPTPILDAVVAHHRGEPLRRRGS